MRWTSRKGTVVKTTVLVFVAGSLMGFSRVCSSPEMVIVGRFITGIHSGTLAVHTDRQTTAKSSDCRLCSFTFALHLSGPAAITNNFWFGFGQLAQKIIT